MIDIPEFMRRGAAAANVSELNGLALASLNTGHCPACGYRGFVLGPRGLNGLNIECGNLECRARYNVASASYSHRIVLAWTIPREAEGGARW